MTIVLYNGFENSWKDGNNCSLIRQSLLTGEYVNNIKGNVQEKLRRDGKL